MRRPEFKGPIFLTVKQVAIGLESDELVTAYLNNRGEFASQLVYLFKRPHSAEFYSRGRTRFAEQASDTEACFQNAHRDYFAVGEGNMKSLPETVLSHVEEWGNFNGYALLKGKLRYPKGVFRCKYSGYPYDCREKPISLNN